MDRLDAMTVFVAVVERGSLAAAARELRRSPAAITRQLAALESHLGSVLLRRTTRALKLTDAGAQYLAACRRILAELADAERVAAGERAQTRGTLAITAPVVMGQMHVQPIVDAFVAANPDVRARIVYADRVVHLVDEGIDVAIRVGALPDSDLLAARVGEVRRVLCASPAYLATHRAPRTPAELARHACIAFTQLVPDRTWAFGRERVDVAPRLAVNTAAAAIASARAGHGITCVLSYQVAAELRGGALARVLEAFEPPALPVHVVYSGGGALTAKVRAFVDVAVPRLRDALR
ncbi:MAG TPA: LysR family transcriptional regulator [Kofleriaceae bacterium]|nr:LysR family transcriptional regulator [Kofleriaceae bacterium]